VTGASKTNCKNNYYCKPLYGECGFRKYDGFCTKIPNNKDDCKKASNNKVCTCDNKTEKNECYAEYKSKGVSSYGSC